MINRKWVTKMINKNNKRLANRTTIVKGFVINTETQEFTPFEETISYARSAQKAAKLVREKMQLDDSPSIVVTVNEIVNESLKPIKYNESKIYNECYNCFDNEIEAQEAADTDNNICKAITRYKIGGYVWAINEKGIYITEYFEDETPMNMTKVDQRGFMRMMYEGLTGNKVIGLHAVEKRPVPLYCVITAENLEKCIEQ